MSGFSASPAFALYKTVQAQTNSQPNSQAGGRWDNSKCKLLARFESGSFNGILTALLILYF